jgi:tetratricopeptide (TPR) repeat protein
VSPENSTSDRIRDEFLEKIQEALVLRDWERLESFAGQWLKLDSRNPSAFKWLARASVALNKMQRAAYAYGRILDFHPDNEEAKRFFVDYPSTLSEAPAALVKSANRTAVKDGRDPDEAAFLKLLPSERKETAEKITALARELLGRNIANKAAELFKIANDLSPAPESLLGLAQSLQKISRAAQAIHLLKDELRAQPQWSAGRLLLGRILLETGQTQAAQREWQLVMRHDPENRDAMEFLKSLARTTAPIL